MDRNYEIDTYNGEKVQYTEIMTIEKVKEECKDMLEIVQDIDTGRWLYQGIGSEIGFVFEKHALQYEFDTDELYQYIKDLGLNDKVVQRYAGSSEEDCFLVPYIPYN